MSKNGCNVLLFQGISQYNALRNYIEEIEMGFRLSGYHTYLIDGAEKSRGFQLEELSGSETIDLIFTCNVIAAELLRQYFPRAFYATYLTDHPASHDLRLKTLDARSIVFTCDRRHEAYIRRFFPNIKYVKFIPLSGLASKREVPYRNRSRDLIFTGSYGRPEDSYEAISKCGEELKELAGYMAEAIIAEPSLDLESCLQQALPHFQMTASDQEFHRLACLLDPVLTYARYYYRDKMIRSLVSKGLKVHVFGNGWEAFQGEGKENLIIEKGNDYVARKAVADAKISLNIMPWFKDGFQERIAAAMLSGTVAVTDESAYIHESFADGGELVLYSLKHLEELPDKIKWLLSHPEDAERIARAGRVRAVKELTWQHRTFEMVRYIQEWASLFPAQAGQYGQIRLIPYRTLQNRQLAQDAASHMYEIMDLIGQVKQYDRLEVCDIEYLYARFLFYFAQVNANYPELQFSGVVYDFLMHVNETQTETAAELLNLECMHMLSFLLNWENQELEQEKKRLQAQAAAAMAGPNSHSWQVLIGKLKANYGALEDPEIQDILQTVEQNQYVMAYNQRFIWKFQDGIAKFLELIRYDQEAGMHYGLWNGRRMYYPREYSKEMAASAFRFACVEQDPDSPHRYLDSSFDVQEGDIVVDAGVAEGNFALDVVEKAKKVYLVECEHKWVEALQKTFAPWQEKVVIVEKLLGDRTDEQCITIDQLVEEGLVNFLKLDVEGAEIASLKGASRVLANSRNVRCAVCAYHKKNAERDIRRLLESCHFYTSTTKGYMFFKEDMDSWIDGELRHGIVRAVKCES